MLKIGLTGGIGSGKSAASAHFERLGVPVIDTDLLSRELVEPGEPALQDIVDHFGNHVLDPHGMLDRTALRQQVFNNPKERRQLEQLLHPRIRERMLQRIGELDAPYVICAIPLLTETGQQKLIDRVLVIDVDETTQIERIRQRDRLDDDMIQQILASQASRTDRLAIADDVIPNLGSKSDLNDAVEQLHMRYLKLAKRH